MLRSFSPSKSVVARMNNSRAVSSTTPSTDADDDTNYYGDEDNDKGHVEADFLSRVIWISDGIDVWSPDVGGIHVASDWGTFWG